jgi:disulfide bond formation protein DsbB
MTEPADFAARDRAARFFMLALVACLGILGYALYLQHGTGLSPCPWCVVQRVFFIAVAFVALLAALHRPRTVGIGVYAALGVLTALAGTATAGYHIWLQRDPKRAAACAGSPLERLLDASRIGEWVPPLLQYDGTCAPEPWQLLGLSIPEWSLACFAALAIWMAVVPRLARR